MKLAQGSIFLEVYIRSGPLGGFHFSFGASSFRKEKKSYSNWAKPRPGRPPGKICPSRLLLGPNQATLGGRPCSFTEDGIAYTCLFDPFHFLVTFPYGAFQAPVPPRHTVTSLFFIQCWVCLVSCFFVSRRQLEISVTFLISRIRG